MKKINDEYVVKIINPEDEKTINLLNEKYKEHVDEELKIVDEELKIVDEELKLKISGIEGANKLHGGAFARQIDSEEIVATDVWIKNNGENDWLSDVIENIDTSQKEQDEKIKDLDERVGFLEENTIPDKKAAVYNADKTVCLEIGWTEKNKIETFATTCHTVPSYLPPNITSLNLAFFQNDSTEIKGTENWDTSKVTIFGGVFGACYNLTNIKGIENWDTSNGKEFQNICAYSPKFNQDLSKWDVSSDTNHFNFDYGADAWQDDFKPKFPATREELEARIKELETKFERILSRIE